MFPRWQVDEVNMRSGSTFAILGNGRTLLASYPTGTTRSSYQGRVVDAHIYAAVTGQFVAGSRVLTLSGQNLWLTEGATGTQWNVLLRDDGIRLYLPFDVDQTAVTAATVYLARMV